VLRNQTARDEVGEDEAAAVSFSSVSAWRIAMVLTTCSSVTEHNMSPMHLGGSSQPEAH
jgi:hypothetical protein